MLNSISTLEYSISVKISRAVRFKDLLTTAPYLLCFARVGGLAAYGINRRSEDGRGRKVS